MVFIFFLSLFGYYIKPTVIIILIAIIIVEFIFLLKKKIKINKEEIKKIIVMSTLIFASILSVVLINHLSIKYLNFKKINTPELTMVHYLAIGQNNKTNGGYNQDDIEESVAKGMKMNLNKAKNRILKRGFIKNIQFYSKKILSTYNDGSFAWGMEGSFYLDIPKRNNIIYEFVTKVMFNNGKYYKYYIQIYCNIWLITLFFTILFGFSFKKSKSKSVMELSIMGISIFLLLFECRARYLFLYLPIFVVISIIGFNSAIDYIHKK